MLQQYGKSATLLQRRLFWQWLNHVFNRYDKKEVEKLGPDIVAARWALRCGAHVRWKDDSKYTVDYNALPETGKGWLIEGIDGTDSSISAAGFEHLNGLSQLKELKLIRCQYLGDDAMPKLRYVQRTLAHLEVVSCGSLTDQGICDLGGLNNLKFLQLYDLPSVKDRERCLKLLTTALPSCKVEFPAVTGKLSDKPTKR